MVNMTNTSVESEVEVESHVIDFQGAHQKNVEKEQVEQNAREEAARLKDLENEQFDTEEIL